MQTDINNHKLSISETFKPYQHRIGRYTSYNTRTPFFVISTLGEGVQVPPSKTHKRFNFKIANICKVLYHIDAISIFKNKWLTEF